MNKGVTFEYGITSMFRDIDLKVLKEMDFSVVGPMCLMQNLLYFVISK